MTALLGLIPSKVWLYGALFIAVIIGVKVHDNKLLAEGIAQQKAVDDAATAALIQQTAKQTADLQARATMAEQAYAHEQFENQNYRDSHPLPAVRLCGNNAHGSGTVVSKGGATVAGNAEAGSGSGNVQSLPAGSDSVGADENPDISGLLDLLAQRADDTSAELREYQARDSD